MTPNIDESVFFPRYYPLEISPELRAEIAATFPLYATLSPAQLSAALCPDQFQSWPAGRRGGKTFLLQRKALQTALLNPGGITLYIALTRKSAGEIGWQLLLQGIEEFQIPLWRAPNQQDGTIIFANGHQIRYSGADNTSKVKKVEGSRYVLCLVDECGLIPPNTLDYLITEALHYALIDDMGQLILTGRPGQNPWHDRFWHKACTEHPLYTKFKWTVFDNPAVASNAKKMFLKMGSVDPEFLTSVEYQRNVLCNWVFSSVDTFFNGWTSRNEILLPGALPVSLKHPDVRRIAGVYVDYKGAWGISRCIYRPSTAPMVIEKTFAGFNILEDYHKIKTELNENGPVTFFISQKFAHLVPFLRNSLEIEARLAPEHQVAANFFLFNEDLRNNTLFVANGDPLIVDLQKCLASFSSWTKTPDPLCDLRRIFSSAIAFAAATGRTPEEIIEDAAAPTRPELWLQRLQRKVYPLPESKVKLHLQVLSALAAGAARAGSEGGNRK
ncbi:MAG: hypothetical protein E6R03_17580 [Hyphomicrobiaceae bacterium]|nr:MAG: hypothetical protein E6R03_17580 [Hyphomicrobiaceae bacterium]